MKLKFNFQNKSYEKYWNGFQFAILVGIFSYYFLENFILSESWEVLTLRSIDDFAMNDSIRQMQQAILGGNWKRVFTFFDYGYGNIFWLVNAILLMPLYAIGDAQLQIIVGRELSLSYVFASIYLVGLVIDRLQPNAHRLKYPILISIATMPIVAIISTKLHVNAQTLFFGILSFYLLIRETQITRKYIFWSGVFGGIAIGLKLTAIFIIPLLALTLISRLFNINNGRFLVKNCLIFFLTLTIVASVCIVPTLLLFPFFSSELKTTYETFQQFKSMGGGRSSNSSLLTIANSFNYYYSLPTIFALIFFYILLIRDEIKKQKYISVIMFFVLCITVVYLMVTVNKDAVYLASYYLNVSFIIPLGFLGIIKVHHNDIIKIILIYLIIILGLFYGKAYREKILEKHEFYKIVNSEKVVRQLNALNAMRPLVEPIHSSIRVLQDHTTIFPKTRFSEDGVYVVYNYGTLRDYSIETWGKFDYIVLNSKNYFGKESESEERTRQLLIQKGEFYGIHYSLVYEGYDTLLYKLTSN